VRVTLPAATITINASENGWSGSLLDSLGFWFQRLSNQIVCAGGFGTSQGNGNITTGFPRSFQCLIRAMRTGSTVNAAVVENTIPPNMTVAKRAGTPELAPINAIGRTPTNAHSPMRKTSRNFA
jgi:hypothetical protein